MASQPAGRQTLAARRWGALRLWAFAVFSSQFPVRSWPPAARRQPDSRRLSETRARRWLCAVGASCWRPLAPIGAHWSQSEAASAVAALLLLLLHWLHCCGPPRAPLPPPLPRGSPGAPAARPRGARTRARPHRSQTAAQTGARAARKRERGSRAPTCAHLAARAACITRIILSCQSAPHTLAGKRASERAGKQAATRQRRSSVARLANSPTRQLNNSPTCQLAKRPTRARLHASRTLSARPWTSCQHAASQPAS